MTELIAQHGPAKGQKINVGIEKKYLSGVIFAPREENYQGISKFCETTDDLEYTKSFLDPQLYYSTFEGEIFKHLENGLDYPTQVSRRDWRKKTPELMNFLNQHAVRSEEISDNLITPGFYIESLDWKFDYTLDIYEYCYENYEFENYYLPLLISTKMFHGKSDVDEMLEDIMDIIDDKDGIYFALCHEKTSERNYEYMDAQTLANILYFTYSLKRGGFKLLVGYTFVNTLLFAMLDCEMVATGWFNTLRKFSVERFEEIDRMGRRKKRYLSIPLLTYIPFDDLNDISEKEEIEQFLSGCQVDRNMLENQEAISYVDLELQYWEALHGFIIELNEIEGIPGKIKYMLQHINRARSLYGRILEALSEDKEIYGRIKGQAKHLDVWVMSIEAFKNRLSIL